MASNRRCSRLDRRRGEPGLVGGRQQVRPLRLTERQGLTMNAPSQVRRWQAWQTSASRTHARASAPPPAVNCSPKLSRSRMAKIALPGLPTSDRPCQKPWSDLLFFELEGLTRSDQAVQAAFVPHMVD